MNIDFSPLYLSLKVACFATLLTILLAIPLGYFLARCNFWGKDLLDSLFTLPLVLPPTV
jgi:molybdate transport system permease protein